MENEGRRGRRARYAGPKEAPVTEPPPEGPIASLEAVVRLGESITGYLAATDRVETLREELGGDVVRHGRLLLAPGPPRDVAWAILFLASDEAVHISGQNLVVDGIASSRVE